jgi:serine/threonine protein phosphatase 1
MKNIYVVSDVHGFYNELTDCLDKSGYDENDENSLLVDCGDFFDRGEFAVEIYKYYKRLTNENKAIVLRGNHTSMLIDFLEGKDSSFNFEYNGLDKTIDSFLGDTDSFSTFMMYVDTLKEAAQLIYGKRVLPILDDNDYSIPSEIYYSIFEEYARERINEDYPELLGWLKERPYYYETKNYIFTHASIDGTCEDWHNPVYTKYDFWSPWEWLTWDNGSFYGSEIKNTDKTIVVGHYHTDGIREKFNIKVTGTNEILITEDGKKIFIDTCTPISRRVNVLTITNEELL